MTAVNFIQPCNKLSKRTLEAINVLLPNPLRSSSPVAEITAFLGISRAVLAGI